METRLNSGLLRDNCYCTSGKTSLVLTDQSSNHKIRFLLVGTFQDVLQVIFFRYTGDTDLYSIFLRMYFVYPLLTFLGMVMDFLPLLRFVLFQV